MPIIKRYNYTFGTPLWLLVLDQVNWYVLRHFGMVAKAWVGGWLPPQWGLRVYKDHGQATQRLIYEREPRLVRRVSVDERPIGRLGVLRFWLWFYLSPTLNRYRLISRYYQTVGAVHRMRAAYYQSIARGRE